MVGMSFSSWKGASLSSALVDSALDGSQDAASLFWTSVSLDANPLATTRIRIETGRTIHLVTRPVSLPAILRCMGELHHEVGTVFIRVFPDQTPKGFRTHRVPGHT